MKFDLRLHGALAVVRRNFMVWKRLFWTALVLNLGEPALYLLGLGLGLGSFVGTLDGLPYLAFLASGLVASSAMNTATFEGMYSVYTRMVPQKTYEAMLATPLRVQDILLGEMIWCGAKASFSAAGILLVSLLLGVVHSPAALLALPAAFLTGLAFAGPAIVMSARADSYDFFNYYFVLVITPMLLVCGVFYPVESLPDSLRLLVNVLPLTHAVELIRPMIIGSSPTHPTLNMVVLLLYAMAGFFLANHLAHRRLLS